MCVCLHTHMYVGELDHNVRCIYFLLKIVVRKVQNIMVIINESSLLYLLILIP